MKKDNKDKNKLQNNQYNDFLDNETVDNSSYDEFALYDNLTNDYQFYDSVNNDIAIDTKSSKDNADNLLIAELNENALVKNETQGEIVFPENKPIKVKEIAVQSDTTKVNAFDLFFLRLWAAIVSLLGYCANGVNALINLIFKRKLPLKYVKAFLAVLFVVLFLIAILVPATANNQRYSSNDGLVVFESNMVPVMVRVDDGSGEPVYKWGYLDKSKAPTGTGKSALKIAAKYEEALPFNKFGIAWARVLDKDGHYWELINTKGERVGKRVYPVSTSVPIGERPFGEFTDSRLCWVNENGKFGYIDTKGNVKIACNYDKAGNFIDGIARVGRGRYEWYINRNGKVIGRSYDYSEVLDFSCGLGAVNKGGRWGFINKKGKEVIELKYDAVSQFVDGYAMVKMGKTVGLIDTAGDLIINTQWFYDIYIDNPIFKEFIEKNF